MSGTSSDGDFPDTRPMKSADASEACMEVAVITWHEWHDEYIIEEWGK